MSAGFTAVAFDNFGLYRKTQCVGHKRPTWARDIFGRAEVVERKVHKLEEVREKAHHHVTLRCAGSVKNGVKGCRK
jgi:hypothetical protein